MLFNSLDFLVFFIFAFTLYWLKSKHVAYQNIILLIASCFFYAWVDWRFLFLIGFTALLTYGTGNVISKIEVKNVSARKFALTLNIVINLVILGFFKYYNFFADSFNEVFQTIGISFNMSTLRIILPIGISFYTFKAVSYSVDLYKGRIVGEHNLLAVLCYLLFFPQLLAGPIEKARDLYPQFLHERKFSYSQAVEGSKLIIWGLFKKIVIADTACGIVNSIYGDYSSYNSSALLICALLYSFQIYGDFSGYSDMAIGIGNLFGIKSKKNFNLPYLSRDIAEFWKRWHISLNTWFVEYVYIPLGGSRVSKFITIRNTFIIFLLSGLWHGANWTFICWGVFHALLFVPLLLLGKTKRFSTNDAKKNFSHIEWLNIVLTFFLVSIGWVIFRSPDIHTAFYYLVKLFTISDYGIPNINPKRLFAIIECSIAILFVVILEIKHKNNNVVLSFKTKSRLLNNLGYLIVATWAILFYSVGQTFIYFQF